MSEPQKPHWVHENKIDDTAFENFKKEAEQNNCPPLAIAFENGFVDETKCLEKEQKKSELFILDRVFFNTEPSPEIFKDYNFEAFKKNGLLPIGKWEEHTYFAKINPAPTPLDSNLSNPIFVLAPWTAMKKWFQVWEKTKTTSVEKKEAVQGIMEVSAETLNSINFNDIKLPGIPQMPQAAAAQETVVPQMPQAAVVQETVVPQMPQATIVPAATMIDPFEKWSGFFDKSMHLSVAGEKIKITKTHGNWESNEKFEFIANKPSIFKIALDSQKPYHGYIVSNSTNQEFFDKSNKGILPGHVTVCPVVDSQKVVSLYLGCTTKEKGAALSLTVLEDSIRGSLGLTPLKRAA